MVSAAATIPSRRVPLRKRGLDQHTRPLFAHSVPPGDATTKSTPQPTSFPVAATTLPSAVQQCGTLLGTRAQHSGIPLGTSLDLARLDPVRTVADAVLNQGFENPRLSSG